MEHLRYLKIANFVFAALMGLTTLMLLVFAALFGVLGFTNGDIGSALPGVIGMTVGMLFAGLFAVLMFLAGKRVAEGRGRILQTVLAVLTIGSFPVGTIYAGYALWVCWMNEATKASFEA